MIVSAIILVAPERAFADKAAGKLFEHPDFDPAGIYTMPNMTTLESLNLYAAAIDFLASRYNRRTRSTAASTTGSPTTKSMPVGCGPMPGSKRRCGSWIFTSSRCVCSIIRLANITRMPKC